MLKENGDINWQETLAQIADDKGWSALGAHIRTFNPDVYPPAVFHYTTPEAAQEIVATPIEQKTFNITVMPEATCDGCQ